MQPPHRPASLFDGSLVVAWMPFTKGTEVEIASNVGQMRAPTSCFRFHIATCTFEIPILFLVIVFFLLLPYEKIATEEMAVLAVRKRTYCM